MYKWYYETRWNYHFLNLKTTKISKHSVFVLVTWPWRLPEEWLEVCGSLTVVGAGTMHGFGTDPIRNPSIWLLESRNEVSWFAHCGRIYNFQWGVLCLHICMYNHAHSLVAVTLASFNQAWRPESYSETTILVPHFHIKITITHFSIYLLSIFKWVVSISLPLSAIYILVSIASRAVWSTASSM